MIRTPIFRQAVRCVGQPDTIRKIGIEFDLDSYYHRSLLRRIAMAGDVTCPIASFNKLYIKIQYGILSTLPLGSTRTDD